jgi:hypothetical protein
VTEIPLFEQSVQTRFIPGKFAAHYQAWLTRQPDIVTLRRRYGQEMAPRAAGKVVKVFGRGKSFASGGGGKPRG